MWNGGERRRPRVRSWHESKNLIFFFFFHRGGRNELRSSTSNTSFYVFPWSSEIPWNRIVPRFENDVFLLTMEILDMVRTT